MGVSDQNGLSDLENRLRRASWPQPKGMYDPVKVDAPKHTDTLLDKFFYYVGFPVGVAVVTVSAGALIFAGGTYSFNEWMAYFNSTMSGSVKDAATLGGAVGLMVGYERVSIKWFTPDNKRLYISD